MRYVSIDLETTGLNPTQHQIIEVGAVVDDFNWTTRVPLENLATFHCYIVHDEYHGHPYALSMHAEIFRRIAKRVNDYNYFTPAEFVLQFAKWLDFNYVDLKQGINCAGKNFASFDLPFLKANPHWNLKTRHRHLDPAILYYQAGDSELPDLQTCCKRAGINACVTHTAVEDALLIVQLLRHRLGTNS